MNFRGLSSSECQALRVQISCPHGYPTSWAVEPGCPSVLLEGDLGLILSTCVGSSLPIKWTACISMKNRCGFVGEQKWLLVLHVFSTGGFGQLQGKKDSSLFTFGGNTVSHHWCQPSSLHFPFPPHIWQLCKLTFRHKAIVISLGWVRKTEVGSQYLHETLKIIFIFNYIL